MLVSKKIYGSTLFIGTTELETKYGYFNCYTFQDVIDHKYILALVYGNILDHNNLHIRMHSSCLTSETLGSMDCDCLEQLSGALSKIKEKGAGILFYLMQSGRGASYISKSRGCQLVQFMQDSISTFDAYESLGLKHDYRDYRNVKDIMVMMKINNKDFSLMTNNPDKIEKIKEYGINITDVVSIQFPTNIYNTQYLLSKQRSGHLLYYSKTKQKLNNYQPSVEPFEPYHIENAQRFIHCSTYYLPIRPVDNYIIMTEKEMNNQNTNIVTSDILPTGEYLVKVSKIDSSNIKPYWFKAHLYYDIASHSEYIVLTYGDVNKAPVVRLHYEFILNRFPLEDKSYKNRYRKALLLSIKNNSGIIVVANHNGDNTLLGRYILENRAFSVTGIPLKKNLLPSTLLLKHHLGNRAIKCLYSDSSRPEMEISFAKAGIVVKEWICINKHDKRGHYILKSRIDSSLGYLKDIAFVEEMFHKKSEFHVLGIGSSESHANYFVHLAKKYGHTANYISIDSLDIENFEKKYSANCYLVVISQGISPPIKKLLNQIIAKDCSNLHLLTATTQATKDIEKKTLLTNLLEKNANIHNYPIENEYSILIRVIGPLCCYLLIYQMLSKGIVNTMAVVDKLKLLENSKPDTDFVKSVCETDNLIIVVPDKMLELCKNIRNKFMEGAFMKTFLISGEVEFAHGTFQYCESLKKSGNVNVISFNATSKNLIDLLDTEFNHIGVRLFYSNELMILELEHYFNLFVYDIVINKNIDQKNWPGKIVQSIIYN